MKKESKDKVYNGTWTFKIDDVQPWAYYNNAFSKEECEEIIKIGKEFNLQNAKVGIDKVNEVNKKIRLSKISWLYPNEKTEWIFRRLTSYLTNLNEQYFKFDLFGLIEGLQFTVYQSPDNFYHQHVDSSFGCTIRKLSMSLLLSDPKKYKGGDLKLYLGKEPIVLPKEQGKILTFPSYTLHEVTPVTKGTRYSLVAWITGPQFK